jgi:hypothetical protein
MGLISHILNAHASDIYKVSLIKLFYVDFVDQLNWEYTVNLLVFFTFVISNAKKFVHDVIRCVVPMYFSENQEEYANEICYITTFKYYIADSARYNVFLNASSNDYSIKYINLHDNKLDLLSNVPKASSYYVWIPYVLLAQAVLLVGPRFLWSFLLCYVTNIDMGELLNAANNCKNLCNNMTRIDHSSSIKYSLIDPLLRKNSNFKYLTFHMARSFLSINGTINEKTNKQNAFQRKIFNFFQTKKLFLCYLIIKIISFASILIQIFMINYSLDIDLYLLGLKPVLSYIFTLFSNNDLINRGDLNQTSLFFTNSYFFPLRAMCQFKIRELATIHVYNSMCSLPINLFIQYIFLFLSFWYFVLILSNIYAFTKWNLYAKTEKHLIYIRKRLLLEFKKANKRHSSRNKQRRFSCADLIHLHSKENFDGHCKNCNYFLNKFVFEFLNFDFRFFLQIILTNGDEYLIQQILMHFWKMFRRINYIYVGKFYFI